MLWQEWACRGQMGDAAKEQVAIAVTSCTGHTRSAANCLIYVFLIAHRLGITGLIDKISITRNDTKT